MVGIQETKMEVVDPSVIRQLWGNEDIDFCYGCANGQSGGTLLSWDQKCFVKESIVSGTHFSGVSGRWVGSTSCVTIINVYGPQLTTHKEELWSNLLHLKSTLEGSWVFFGDFKAVRGYSERAGSRFDASEALILNNFIAQAGLHDFHLGGRRFTYFNRAGTKMSKLDRFLVSDCFFNEWSNAVVTVLDRVISDHNRLLLSAGSEINFGPKPFRVFDAWFKIKGFDDVVKNSWQSGTYRGTPDIVLKNKIKQLRDDIKCWNSNLLELQKKRNVDILEDLNKWDERAEAGLITSEEVVSRDCLSAELHKIDQIDRDILRQKSRIRWAVEGDENSRFFHATIGKNKRKYSLNGLMCNGIWSTDPNMLKREAFDHFNSRFKSNNSPKKSLQNSKFSRLSSSDTMKLDADFSLKEIKEAVWSCAGSKAPGPDGLNFNFIKRYRDVLEADFVNGIKHFESTGRFSRGCNPSFISLIPKVNDPLSISDYRPISLIGCVYKVISKLLASRLAGVIHKIISPNQTVFIKGRQILDGVLVANEVIDYANMFELNLLLFKVDFANAFDSVRWDFLLDIMKQMGFSSKWRKWIKGCLHSASISILVNGSPTSQFYMERGLRQGDPLSPFLFLIVAEALQVSILEACDQGIFKGLSLSGDGSNISLLQYADDALIFGEWSLANAKNLIDVLKCYNEASGLSVNLAKSCIYGVGVDPTEVDMFARILNCKAGFLPFIYLGLPVGKNMHKVDAWSDVTSRLTSQLSSWKSKLLSIGGRLTLTKAVLGSLPSYYLSLFRAPTKTLESLEKIRSRFFWGLKENEKKMVWVSWRNTMASRDLGGLDVGSLRAKNLSLLGKWCWRILMEKDALWRKVICNLHGHDGGFSNEVSPRLNKGVWVNIIRVGAAIDNLGIPFGNSFIRKVKSGSHTLFWKDVWLDDGPCLMNRFPRLFALDLNPNFYIRGRWVLVNGDWGGCWSWRVEPRGRSASEFDVLLSTINGISLSPGEPDEWKWSLNVNGTFSVNILSKMIDNHQFSSRCLGRSVSWNSWVPRKVNIFSWRVTNDRIPHLSNLDKRGIDVHSLLCPLCESEVEDINHIMFNCPKVKTLWSKCYDWWDISYPGDY